MGLYQYFTQGVNAQQPLARLMLPMGGDGKGRERGQRRAGRAHPTEVASGIIPEFLSRRGGPRRRQNDIIWSRPLVMELAINRLEPAS
jgi:hypothetical protein